MGTPQSTCAGIDKEDLGLLPVAVVTLGAAGWDTVARAEHLVP